MRSNPLLLLLLLQVATLPTSTAFASKAATRATTSETFTLADETTSQSPIILWSTTLEDDPLADFRKSYIETSRQYRRTRFAHDDWLKHRSPDRFFKNLGTIIFSGIYRGIAKEVLTVTGIATFIVAWNLFLSEGWMDLSGVHHEQIAQLPLIMLPLTPFTLASPSLGLLLGK